jgi:transcriptional regulator with GAF, ATPase, and Fis domain
LNCAALNESLLESELFGHVKGAFTGAIRHRQGRFEVANGGDLFLDEIGDLPLPVQVKLLRVLEPTTFERVGDNRELSVDVRIITATNKIIPELISKGQFREDLFFRINVIPVHLPPLRERTEDIPLLADHFIHRLRAKSDKDIKGLSPETLKIFMEHSWPGNVRELKSSLEYAFVLADAGHIEPRHLPSAFTAAPGRVQAPAAAVPSDQKEQLLAALRKAGGNKSEAARILGINRLTVLNRMRKYGIDLKKVIES